MSQRIMSHLDVCSTGSVKGATITGSTQCGKMIKKDTLRLNFLRTDFVTVTVIMILAMFTS